MGQPVQENAEWGEVGSGKSVLNSCYRGRSGYIRRFVDRNLTILLAEDDENYALRLKRALETNGWKNPIQMVPNGREAIEYLQGEDKYADRETYAFPSVMFLDIKMPRATGLDVLRWVKEHPQCSVLPTMMLTSSNEEKDIKLAYALGANAYFTKPARTDDLKRLLRVACEFWHLSVRPKFNPSPSC